MNYSKREQTLQDKINELNLDGFISSNQNNISYLTNFSGSTSIFVMTLYKNYIIADFRYYTQVENECKNVELIKVGDLKDCQARLMEFLPSLNLKKLGFESGHISVDTYNRWKDKFQNLELVPIIDLVEDITVIKEQGELELIRNSIKITETALIEILKQVKEGMTEREIAANLEFLMRKTGSDKTCFDTIIASGWRTALPHGSATDKQIKNNEFLTVDCGVQKDGYCADITRTIVLGEYSQKQEQIWNLVNYAKNTAIKKAKAGMVLKELDSIARDIITDAGYGENFGHGLGHGVGRMVHTKPKVDKHGEGTLETGMIITIEPGIYIKDFGGVRLEDMVLIKDDGCEVLTTLPCSMTYTNSI